MLAVVPHLSFRESSTATLSDEGRCVGREVVPRTVEVSQRTEAGDQEPVLSLQPLVSAGNTPRMSTFGTKSHCFLASQLAPQACES